MLLGHAHQNPRTPQMGGGRCGGKFPGPAPGAAEEYPGSRRDVLNAERDGGFTLQLVWKYAVCSILQYFAVF